jgi:hypothetical protein
LRQRVAQRKIHGRDASEADMAVLEAQLASQDPLGMEELRHTVAPDSGWDMPSLQQRVFSCLTFPDQPSTAS